jgi:hypothetical protein
MVNIFIKLPNGKMIPIFVEQHNHIYRIKQHLQDCYGVPTDRQKLYFQGYQLDDNISLLDHNIHHEDVLHILFVK